MNIQLDMKSLNLLLVEDNEGDVVLAKEALNSVNSKINLNVAEDGRDALKMLRRQSPISDSVLPDALLLDINLPGMSGKELLKIIKTDERLKSLPVIILSTTSSPNEIKEVFDLQANWYATKPDRAEDFRKLILRIEFLLTEKVVCRSFENFTIS